MTQPVVTLKEISVLLEQGADDGVFEDAEHEMVTTLLSLDDRHVGAVLTPRSDVVFLDVRDPLDATREALRQDRVRCDSSVRDGFQTRTS